MRGRTPPEGNRVWCETPSGVSEGPFLSWHGDGQKKTEGSFEDGAAAGLWRSWYDNGQLRSEGRYDAGERVGTWRRYDRDGAELGGFEEAKVEVEVEPMPRPRHLIGIPECDRFLEGYVRCVDTKAPESVREQIHAAIEATAEAWKKAADTPAGRDGLVQACKTAIEAVKQTTAAWGCEF